jgi:tetratricopeptide (TPR) repeat protein
VVCLALLVTACGAPAPKQAETASPEAVAPSAPKPAELSATAGDAGRRAGRREENRSGRPSAPQADAVEPVPEAAALAYARAVAALEAQDWLRAELELEQLARDFPALPGPHVNLAIVYRHDGRSADARAALARALEVSPGNSAANNQLGILLRSEGKFEEAENAYQRALATDPSYPLAHYNLGVLLDVYLRRGAEAIPHYEAYQSSRSEPDKTVAGWLIDLRRRFGNAASTSQRASQVAEEDGA